MGGNGWRRTSSLPSVCPTSLSRIIHRYNSARRSLNSSDLYRVFVASTDLHKQISLIFHVLFVQCARTVQPRWNALQCPQKAEEPLIFQDTTPRYRTNPGAMFQPPSIRLSREHLYRACFSLPCTRVPMHRRRFQSCWILCSCD